MDVTKPTYLQAQEAYQLFLEKHREYPNVRWIAVALEHAERLRDDLWWEQHSGKASLPWRYGRPVMH